MLIAYPLSIWSNSGRIDKKTTKEHAIADAALRLVWLTHKYINKCTHSVRERQKKKKNSRRTGRPGGRQETTGNLSPDAWLDGCFCSSPPASARPVGRAAYMRCAPRRSLPLTPTRRSTGALPPNPASLLWRQAPRPTLMVCGVTGRPTSARPSPRARSNCLMATSTPRFRMSSTRRPTGPPVPKVRPSPRQHVPSPRRRSGYTDPSSEQEC
eukprot:scaffold11085_cov105-Isochrysis_galbana.AAC.1